MGSRKGSKARRKERIVNTSKIAALTAAYARHAATESVLRGAQLEYLILETPRAYDAWGKAITAETEAFFARY